MSRGKLRYKSKDGYEGIVSYQDVKYTEEELTNMGEEFYQLEKELSEKYKDYDSEYSFELGKILASKLEEYKILQSQRYDFWKMLREYVNKKDTRKTITDKRDAYEYCYMLSKLNKELVIKFSRSKWDHLFDVVTARKDNRLYTWLNNTEDEILINNNLGFQNFCKGLKIYLKDIDTEFLSDDEIFKYYDEVLQTTKQLIKYEKDNGVKLKSKERDIYYSNYLNSNGAITPNEFFIFNN